jgi:hypothetical protein
MRHTIVHVPNSSNTANHRLGSRKTQPGETQHIAHQSPLRDQETRLLHFSHHPSLGLHRTSFFQPIHHPTCLSPH